MSLSEDLYATPEAPVTHNNVVRRELLGKILTYLGAALQVPLVAGIGVFIAKMVISFEQISLYGTGDEKIMSDALSQALVGVIVGMIFAIPGYLMNIVGYLVSDFRSDYVNKFLLTLSVIWIFLFPVGTVLAIVFFIVYSTRK